MYYADVLIIQIYLPYALFFCFSANCYLDVLSSISVAVFNWHIDSVISITFFQCSVHGFDGCELAKSSMFRV